MIDRPSLFVVELALCVLLACAPQVDLRIQAPATRGLEPDPGTPVKVTRVVDGDTVVVRLPDGVEEKVRLLGIDTPESVDPRKAVQCFGSEASAATDALLSGREVTLVPDVEDRDSFDRLLRYVYIGDEMANARLVANGYAFAYTYPPNVRHADLFLALQAYARDHSRGLWSRDTCEGRR